MWYFTWQKDDARVTKGADLDYPGGPSLNKSLEVETLSWPGQRGAV